MLNRDWYIVAPGDGMWSVIDPSDPELVWSSTNDATGQAMVYDERTQQSREVSPYARANGDMLVADLPYRFNWDTPVAFVPAKVLVGGNVLFESADRGQTWTPISPDLTRNDKSHQQISGGPIDEDISGAETSDTILDVETTPLARGPSGSGPTTDSSRSRATAARIGRT